MAMAVPLRRRAPRVGHVNAAYGRIDRLADEFGSFTRATRLAIGHIVLAENAIKRAKEALAAGDVGAAQRLMDVAEQEVRASHADRDRAANLSDSMEGMLRHFRRWLGKVGL